jgi:hypothetical protein
MSRLLFTFTVGIIFLIAPDAKAAESVLDSKLHHLRCGDTREWGDFPVKPEATSLMLTFPANPNSVERTLRLRQQDVKQAWQVSLNGKELGRLVTDENDMVVYFTVPAERLKDGENDLRIESASRIADDIYVGEISLDDRPMAKVLSEATVEITVLEAQLRAKSASIPSRITILTAGGSLMATGAKSTDGLAVRSGIIYTADGHARFTLPAGEYIIYAGRGFEYGIDSVRITLKAGDMLRKSLTIRREVPTLGWASCDTHVHTLTHSGHGDATVEERAVTVAGEGLELPVAAEHNKQVDYHGAAVKAGVRAYFTPIVGNEVTTNVGHFNIFSVKAGGAVPDHQGKNWASVFAEIGKTEAGVTVLNHPRDRHAKFSPFGPERHLAASGESLDGWELKATAMEVINSGAQQTDVLQPIRDWFTLLNRGLPIAPVGASDSHDVSRYIVGQARTYVRCKDDHAGKIDIDEVVKSFQAGRVLVSCGLLAEITVNDKYAPGDLAPATDQVKTAIRVLGPSWTTADRVALYANGVLVKEESIADGKRAGVKWSSEWTFPRFRHDVHLVVVASGPGDMGLYWPIGKPYQPAGPGVRKRVIGLTGAVWVDADGDGKRTSALDYARRVNKEAGGKWPDVVQKLVGYDEAVAIQAAGLLQAAGVALGDREIRDAAKAAGPAVEKGFAAVAESWRESRIARDAKR